MVYYAEINTAGNKFGSKILCILRFKWYEKLSNSVSLLRDIKEFGPAYYRILYDKIYRNYAESTALPKFETSDGFLDTRSYQEP